MGRCPCLCLALLKHLLPFGPVVCAGCCRAGGHYHGGDRAGGNEGSGWYRAGVGAPEAGQVGSKRAGGYYRGGLLLMILA